MASDAASADTPSNTLENAQNRVNEVTTRLRNLFENSVIFSSFPQMALDSLNEIEVIEQTEFITKICSSHSLTLSNQSDLVEKYKNTYTFLLPNVNPPKIFVNASTLTSSQDITALTEDIIDQIVRLSAKDFKVVTLASYQAIEHPSTNVFRNIVSKIENAREILNLANISIIQKGFTISLLSNEYNIDQQITVPLESIRICTISTLIKAKFYGKIYSDELTTIANGINFLYSRTLDANIEKLCIEFISEFISKTPQITRVENNSATENQLRYLLDILLCSDFNSFINVLRRDEVRLNAFNNLYNRFQSLTSSPKTD